MEPELNQGNAPLHPNLEDLASLAAPSSTPPLPRSRSVKPAVLTLSGQLILLGGSLPGQGSNLDKRNQNPLCYHYTTGQETGRDIASAPRKRQVWRVFSPA